MYLTLININNSILMKKSIFLILFSALILSGCGSELTEFNDQAYSFASDKKIDPKEYKFLLDFVSNTTDKSFKQFKDEKGKIDSLKVVAYLLKYYSAKKLAITSADIWQPEITVTKADKFNINVFLENSGSMNGYLNDPNTQFKNSVYSLLTRLKLFVDKDSLNLFFINKSDQLLYKNATNQDVEKFKDILNPTSFNKISVGKTQESDLNDLINRCLRKSNENNLSVFISDCIYSPGKSHPDAAQYLAEQKQGVFLNFATALKESDVSVMVIQIFANFKGTYWDKKNNPVSIPTEIQRPFYIWFIGSRKQISLIQKSKKLNELDGGYKNKVVFQKIVSTIEPTHAILPRPTFGSFDRTELANFIITNATPSKGLFGFNVAVNFSDDIQDENFYTDTANYKVLNDNYRLTIEKIPKSNSYASFSDFTHLLKLQTTSLRDESLRIDVIGCTPSWAYNSSSNDDLNIANDNSQQQKTFGFRYLIEGVSDAFYPKSNTKPISSISIKIKK